MADPLFNIRTITRREVDLVTEWATEEGWNPGLHDAHCFYETDPNGFLIGELGNEPVALISAVRFGDTYGFIGYYLVKSARQGEGYGPKLWNAAMAYLEDRNVQLDGLVEQQEEFGRSGFDLAHRNVRYEGRGGGGRPDDARILPLTRVPFDAIADYDRPFFPADRTAFLGCWLALPDSTALGLIEIGSTLSGYGMIRRCPTGHKIGPLFADTPEHADLLYRALAAQAGIDEPVYLDVPEGNPAAVALAERYGLTASFETVRMYTRARPDLPLDRIFGVATFELG